MNILRRGRLQVAPDEDIMHFTSSMEADKRIFDADIEVDKAHVVMLREQGIIRRAIVVQFFRVLKKYKKRAYQPLIQLMRMYILLLKRASLKWWVKIQAAGCIQEGRVMTKLQRAYALRCASSYYVLWKKHKTLLECLS